MYVFTRPQAYVALDNRVVVKKTCSVKNEEYRVTVDMEKYNEWKAGELIHKVFPNLSTNDREFLISGATPAEWDNMFGGLEE